MDRSLAVLSDVTIFQKYARYIPGLNRRENWDEILKRWTIMMVNKYPDLQDKIESVVSEFVKPKKVLMSMRGLQFAGKAIERNPSRLYNCSYTTVNTVEVFSEVMFLLLSGCGVGYSVQMHHVAQLPPVLGPRNHVRHMIADSIEGWSDAVKALVEAYFYGKPKPIFDYSEIRLAGTRLKVSGGKAPGAKPLAKCLAAIERILKKATGRWLRPIEVHDILCLEAVAVLSGGIRRSAMIALFSPDDKAMAECKMGEWWIKNPQRGKANNSAVFMRDEITREMFNTWWDTVKASRCGEPGLVFTNHPDWGVNPCCEIALKPNNFCNLCEVNISAAESQEQLESMVAAAAFLGTLQAGFTDFHYLRPIWRETTEEDALLGVSLTGIAGMKKDLDLEAAARVAVSVNIQTAKEIGIKPAKRVTCVKPSGTTSLVMGTSSGVHPWHSQHYIRRIRLNKMEPLYAYLNRRIPELLEDSVYDTTDAVLSLPVKAIENGVMRSESALDFLERVKMVHQTWIKAGHIDGENTHNCSATVSIGDDEWTVVGNWMWDNRDSYTGLSVIPRDVGTYSQTPFEECSEEKYLEMMDKVRGLDLTQVIETDDMTALNDNIACAGGACLI